MMRRSAPVALIGLILLVIAACGSSSATNPPASASDAAGPSASTAQVCAESPVGADPAVTVEIKDFAFAPDPIEAKVGEVIAWTNQDPAPHTASLADGACTTSQLATGTTGALVFNAPGTYSYQCNIHPGQMKDYTIEITE